MKTANPRADIFFYSKELRGWPKSIDLPVSIVVNKSRWSLETSTDEGIEHFLALEEATYDDGPMITLTMMNGASLVIVEIDPEGKVQPEGSLRGDWQEYHQNNGENLLSILEVSRNILKSVVKKSKGDKDNQDNRIDVIVTPAVVRNLADVLAESESSNAHDGDKNSSNRKRFLRQAMSILKFLKVTGDAQKNKNQPRT